MMNKYVLYFIGIIIFLPDLIIIDNIYPVISKNLYIYFILAIGIITIISKFIKNYGNYFLPVFALIISIFALKTVFKSSKIVIKYFYFLPDIPLNYEFLITIIFSISIIAIIYGILSDKFTKIISDYIISTGILLDQIAAITFMKISSLSYIKALIFVNYEDYYSLYTLFTKGYQTFLPLNKIILPVNSLLFYAFIISLIFSLLWLYINAYSNKDSAVASYSIVIGIIFGYLFFEFIDYMNSFSLQFISITAMVLIIFIVIAITDKKSIKENIN